MTGLPTLAPISLQGKRALVTGGSAGIGLGAAAALAGVGTHVTIIARERAPLDMAVNALSEGEQSVQGVALDVTDTAAWVDFVTTEAPFDVLVNCAGMSRNGPALETTIEDFDAVMALNVKAAYFVTQQVGKRLIETGRPGSLINISSQYGKAGDHQRAVYSASKHAVEGMTKSLAVEWGEYDIRVNTICPTVIQTRRTLPMLKDPAALKYVHDRIKLNRLGCPSDIMGAVVYLASDWSSMVTGTSLVVDGGWLAD